MTIAVSVLYMSDVHMLVATAATAATAASAEAVSRARGFARLCLSLVNPSPTFPPGPPGPHGPKSTPKSLKLRP